MRPLRIGRITSSDRACAGVYDDLSGPEIEKHVNALFSERDCHWHRHLLPDEEILIRDQLFDLVKRDRCHLILTTGGTGPAVRDVVPEATRSVIQKELSGFGEILRMKSYESVPTSIMSRATAGILDCCLIVNLPGRPSAVAEGIALLALAIQKTLAILEADHPSF